MQQVKEVASQILKKMNDLVMTWWDAGGMGQVGSRAIALGPIEQHMSCTVHMVIQRLYESQTHAVAGHSSTNEDSPSCTVSYTHLRAHET